MTQQDLVITTEDIQSVLRADPNVALRVQNQALMRRLGEVQGEVDRLTQELENCRIEEAKQELEGGKNKKGG
jgi:hypothetical protein